MLRLHCFGTLDLHGCASSRISTQHLLLLSYVRLEGPAPRWVLAGLLWPHLAGEFTKKGERKDLSNLGVLLANLRGACGLDLEDREQLTALPCDAAEFGALMQAGDQESALRLASRGAFLADIEHRPRLRLGTELEDWLLARRSQFAGQARRAMVSLAAAQLSAGQPDTARSWAEEAARQGLSGEPLEVQAQLLAVLEQLGSGLATEVDRGLRSSLTELGARLSAEAFRYYLLLALQRTPNSAAAQQAAGLSTRDAALYREQLIEAGLVSVQGEVQPAAAAQHFQTHPLGKLTLLSALRDHTPPEQAWPLYSELYRLSGHFGGIGYWARARQAYLLQGRVLVGQEAYAGAVTLMDELEEAERLNQQPPQRDTRLLHAYALERLGQRARALEVLVGVEDSAEVQALRGALLVQKGAPDQATELARAVLAGAWGEVSPFARALALGTLGQCAYSGGQFLQAERFFEQSAIMWAVAGYPKREIGGQMNRANVLQRLQRYAEVRRLYQDLLARVGDEALRVRLLLNLGYLAEQEHDFSAARELARQARTLGDALDLGQSDPALMANVLLNLGYAEHQCGEGTAARASLHLAMSLALQAGDRVRYAAALGNLGLTERSAAKLEMAVMLFAELGQDGYLQQYRALYEHLLRELLSETGVGGRTEEHQLYRAQLEQLIAGAASQGLTRERPLG